MNFLDNITLYPTWYLIFAAVIVVILFLGCAIWVFYNWFKNRKKK